MHMCMTAHRHDDLQHANVLEFQLYAEKFRRAMRVAMKSASTVPRSGVYSSACFGHCVTLSQEFWTNSVTTLYAGQVCARECPRREEWDERYSPPLRP